jgi:microcystin-dependent protein
MNQQTNAGETAKRAKPLSEKSQVTIKTTLITVLGSVLVAGSTTIGTIYATKSTVARAQEGASEAKTSVDKLKNQVAEAAATQNSMSVPPGTIIAYGGLVSLLGEALEQPGWLLCDGRTVDRNVYSNLFRAIGESWGKGDRVTFHLPDLRGVFLRGVNHGRSGSFADPDALNRTNVIAGGNAGNNVGSYQTDEFRIHTHTWNHGLQDDDSGSGRSFQEYTRAPGQSADSIKATGGNESRPKNAYVNYLIKY